MGIANAFTTIINLIIAELQAPVAVVLGLIIVYCGYVLMFVSAPNEKTKAEKILIFALIGLVLVLFGPQIAEKVKDIVQTNVQF